MSYYKSLYDSNQIREGLMNIKQSQIQLLKQLKNEHNILKKYIPQNRIIQQQQSHQNSDHNNKYKHKQDYSSDNINNDYGSNYHKKYDNNGYDDKFDSNRYGYKQKQQQFLSNKNNNYQSNLGINNLISNNINSNINTNINNNINSNINHKNNGNINTNINNKNNTNINNKNNGNINTNTNNNNYSNYYKNNKNNIQSINNKINSTNINQLYSQIQPQNQPQHFPAPYKQPQLQQIISDYHRIKKQYFLQKQKNKDMILHIEFISSLHNIILKQTLQGIQINTIKNKIKSEIQTYQYEFPQFKQIGIESAFNIVNLHTDNLLIMYNNKSPQIRRNPIFPPRSEPNPNNIQLLKQLTQLKLSIKQLNQQKQYKTQQLILTKSQNQYTITLLKKQLQLKNQKINQFTILQNKYKDINKNLYENNHELKDNVEILKLQLQRNLDKVQNLQIYKKKSSDSVEKQYKNTKYVKQLQQKILFYQKQSKSKSKIIQIHQQNNSKLNQNFKSLKYDNQKLRLQIQQIKKQLQKKICYNLTLTKTSSSIKIQTI